MDKKNIRPLYELKVDSEMGFEVDVISIVDDPAVESNFLVFNKNKKEVKQVFSEVEDRFELLGVAMMANKKIFRINQATGEEYDVFFSAETIRLIAQDFFKKGYQHNISIQHKGITVPAFVFQSYIIDEDKGINAPEGITASNGSWVVGVKVENSNLFKACKDAIFNGFSIEGYFIDVLMKNQNPDLFVNKKNYYQKMIDELNMELDSIISKYNIK